MKFDGKIYCDYCHRPIKYSYSEVLFNLKDEVYQLHKSCVDGYFEELKNKIVYEVLT